jgi:predicted transcriptional regulator
MSSGMRDVREIIRVEMIMKDRIAAVLKKGPATVPEIARAVGRPSCEVMYWVMGLRRYGHIAETEELTGEGYYKYRLTAPGEEGI